MVEKKSSRVTLELTEAELSGLLTELNSLRGKFFDSTTDAADALAEILSKNDLELADNIRPKFDADNGSLVDSLVHPAYPAGTKLTGAAIKIAWRTTANGVEVVASIFIGCVKQKLDDIKTKIEKRLKNKRNKKLVKYLHEPFTYDPDKEKK